MCIRRLALLAMIVLLVGALPLFAGGQQEEPEVDELTMGVLSRGVSNALAPFFDDFEEETGVSVYMEQHAFDALRDQMMLEFAANSGYFDIVYSSPGFLGELVANDHILALNDMMEEYGFEESDFTSAGININRFEGEDEIWGFPYLADTSILLFREDLFNDSDEREAFESEYGYELPIPSVDDPMTTQEFLDVAKFFTRDDMYGFVYPQTGVAYGNLYIMPWIWTFGGEYYDEDYNVVLNSPEALEAVEFAAELQETQPGGVLGYDYGDHLSWFYEGNAAMTMGWFHMGVEANDPEVAPDIAGDVGYAPVPYHPGSGLGHGVPVLGGGGLAITADSRAPELAFEYLNWMFGDTDRALEWYLDGGGATRPEIYEHERVYEKYPWAEEFFPVANHSLELARQRPTLPNSHEIFEITSEMWHNVALGDATPEEAVEWAQEQLEPLLQQFQN